MRHPEFSDGTLLRWQQGRTPRAERRRPGGYRSPGGRLPPEASVSARAAFSRRAFGQGCLRKLGFRTLAFGSRSPAGGAPLGTGPLFASQHR